MPVRWRRGAGPFALFLAFLLSAAPGLSQNAPFTRDSLRDNVSARNIYVCSEIADVRPDTIRAFYEEAFPGWNPPAISAQPRTERAAKGENVLFIASDGELGEDIRSCIGRYSFEDFDLREYVERQAGRLGKGPAVPEGLKLPDYYGPVLAGWGYKRQGSWKIIVFMSREDGPYRSNHAMTNLFGLSMAACARNSACQEIK